MATPQTAPVRFVSTHTATGAGEAREVGGLTIYGLQVAGVDAAPTAWDIRMQGTIDGVNWVDILTHVTATTNGGMVFSGATNRYPLDKVRVNVTALTLGPATSVRVVIEAAP